jgi:hypothetical protein
MSVIRKLGFLVLALALVAAGTMTAQPLLAGSEAGFTMGLFLPFVQAPGELGIEAAKRPVDEAGDKYPSKADELIYISKVHPANVCADLTEVTGDEYVYGLKVEGAAPNGTYESDGLRVTIENSDGKFFDWEKELTPDDYVIGAVVVKAGTGANVYIYEGGADSDTGLHAPGFSKNGGFIYRDISNVTFCLVEGDGNGEVEF